MEPPETEKLHPNWRALASVPFDRKIFVKAKNDVFEADSKAKKAKAIKATEEEGQEAKAYYESVLSEPSTSKGLVKHKTELEKLRDTTKSSSKKTNFQVRKLDLFKAVEQDNIEFVKEALEIQPSWKDLKDCYGWSLLMISCKAGSVKVTKHLIDQLADK